MFSESYVPYMVHLVHKGVRTIQYEGSRVQFEAKSLKIKFLNLLLWTP